MLASPDPVPRVPVPGRPPRVVLGLALLLLALAVAKPWAVPAASRGSTRSATASSAVLAATAAGTPPATARLARADPGLASTVALCQSPAGWRILAEEHEFGRSVVSSTVSGTTDVAAGPDDGAIPFTSLVSPQIVRLGFCAPSAGTAHPDADWTGLLWRRSEPGAAAQPGWQPVARLVVPPDSPGVLTPPGGVAPPGVLAPPGAGALTPPGALPSTVGSSLVASWPPGAYVLEASLPGAAANVWLGIQLRARP